MVLSWFVVSLLLTKEDVDEVSSKDLSVIQLSVNKPPVCILPRLLCLSFMTLVFSSSLSSTTREKMGEEDRITLSSIFFSGDSLFGCSLRDVPSLLLVETFILLLSPLLTSSAFTVKHSIPSSPSFSSQRILESG